MSERIRVQIISEANLIDALKASTTTQAEFTSHDLPDSDQNFGLVEAAAVIAVATSAAKLAEIIVRIYKEIKNDSIEVTIKTAKGALTVKGQQAKTVEALLHQFKEIS